MEHRHNDERLAVNFGDYLAQNQVGAGEVDLGWWLTFSWESN
jgi:hypothetical protein